MKASIDLDPLSDSFDSTSVDSYGSEDESSIYRSLLEEIPVGFALYTTENLDDMNAWKLKAANVVMAKSMGPDYQKLYGMRVADIWGMSKEFHEMLKEAYLNGTTVQSGEVSWGTAFFRTKIVGLPGNQVMLLYEDVNEAKAKEQNSKANKEKMDALLEKAVDAMVLQSGSLAASDDESWMTSAIHSLLTVNLNENEVLVEEQDKKNKVISAADIQTLIHNLSKTDVSKDDTYVKQFLLSFRYFLTPGLLLKKMILKYLTLGSVDEKGLTSDHKRILDVLDLWVKYHFYDFESDIDLLKSLQTFISGTLMNSSATTKIGTNFLRNINKQMHQADNESDQSSPHAYAEQEIARKVNVMDYSASEVANQMTLYVFEILKAVKPMELYSQSWNKEGGAVQSPNVHALIQHFNRISTWIAASVVTCPNLKKRIAALKHFVNIAWAAYGNRDYETTFTIVLALSQQYIFRLAQTWKGLDAVTSKQWEKLQHFTSFRGNYKVYRNKMKHQLAAQGSASMIPYFGLYLKDLSLLEENANFTQKGAVNFLKMRRVADVISVVQRAQQSIFNIPKSGKLMAFLRYGLLQLHEDQIWDLSMKCEATGGGDDRPSQRVSGIVNKLFNNEEDAMITTRNPIFGMKFAFSPKSQRKA
eukprot:TRINITY_DN4540_c0_g2_i1.p1 TRINITY_DN4540_c0_g2~~TRINITY_DN4540_c0_g2_i1.p1  ORF type:complete len:644 (-),score=208.55 TRINITY_DN4540_c0_g2_i1:18-1949(-)